MITFTFCIDLHKILVYEINDIVVTIIDIFVSPLFHLPRNKSISVFSLYYLAKKKKYSAFIKMISRSIASGASSFWFRLSCVGICCFSSFISWFLFIYKLIYLFSISLLLFFMVNSRDEKQLVFYLFFQVDLFLDSLDFILLCPCNCSQGLSRNCDRWGARVERFYSQFKCCC